MRSLLILILICSFLYSCSTAPPNLTTVKKEVDYYYKSGKYLEELQDIISSATDEISKVTLSENSAVIFDVDETSLSNYETIERTDFGYEQGLWDEWIETESAKAIIPVKELYDTLLSQGLQIIFMTGRKDYQYMHTYNNLIKEGFEVFDTLIVRNESEYKLNALEYKTLKRKELTAKGYVIIAVVGDQWSDLEGSNSGIKIKLPNYLYGIE